MLSPDMKVKINMREVVYIEENDLKTVDLNIHYCIRIKLSTGDMLVWNYRDQQSRDDSLMHLWDGMDAVLYGKNMLAYPPITSEEPPKKRERIEPGQDPGQQIVSFSLIKSITSEQLSRCPGVPVFFKPLLPISTDHFSPFFLLLSTDPDTLSL